MNSRLKRLRKAIGISQKKFGLRLGVTDAAICSIEAGKRSLTEQMTKLICREFNVRYDWLKNGEGEMFDQTPESTVDSLVREFQLDEGDRRIILGYLRLSETDRAAVKRYILGMFDALPESTEADVRENGSHAPVPFSQVNRGTEN